MLEVKDLHVRFNNRDREAVGGISLLRAGETRPHLNALRPQGKDPLQVRAVPDTPCRDDGNVGLHLLRHESHHVRKGHLQ